MPVGVPKYDKFALFAEEMGEFLSEREVLFCKLTIDHGCDYAAKKAGYPDPEDISLELYSQHKHIIEAWVKKHEENAKKVHRVYMDGMDASFKDGRPDHKTRIRAADSMAKLMGLNEPTKHKHEVDATTKQEASPEVLEKIEEIRKGIAERNVKG